MRERLKGINRVRKRLADGREVTYWYAWKSGPKLQGEPGSPEFVASFNEAHAAKVALPAGVLLTLLSAFEETSEFRDLAPRTKDDYRKQLKLIEKAFGDLPLEALPDPETRGVFKGWRDELATRSKRQADYAWAVLARVLSVAKDRGRIKVNPCERGGRLYSGSRRDKVWSLDQEKAYLEAAPEHMRLPFLLGAWTGQREGDLLRLPWSGYDGEFIRLRQSKTGVHVTIPVVGPLKEALGAEKARKRGLLVLLTKGGQKWTEHGFRSSWRKACEKAGISGLTFHDLRGTASIVWRSPNARKWRFPSSRGCLSPACATYLKSTTCIAMKRSLRAPARSSQIGRKENENSQPTAQLCFQSGQSGQTGEREKLNRTNH